MDAKEILSKHQNYSAEERIQAVFSLLRDTSQEAFDLLQSTLYQDPSPIVRHEAAYVMGEKGTVTAFKSLVHAIRHDQNKFVVHEAALALGNIGFEEGMSTLQSLLNSPDGDIRDTAEISIQRLENHLSNAEIADAKKTLLDRHELPENRIQASFILMSRGDESDVDTLIMALRQEENPIVKHEIIFSLGETAAHRAISELIKTLERDKNVFVVHETLLALGTLGNTMAEEAIRKFCTDPNTDIAESAKIALERLTGQSKPFHVQ